MANTGKKRSANGMGTIRKKTVIRNGEEYTYWEGRYTTGYDLGTGKQIQKSVSGKTQKEVALKIRQLTREIDAGTYIEPTKLTVAEFLEMWQKEYLNSMKPNTAYHYRTCCRAHLIPALGAIKLAKLTPLMIQHFYNGLKNEKTQEPLAPKTLRNIHGILHKALNCAVRLKYIPSNPADAIAIDLPKVRESKIKPLEDDEIAQFIRASKRSKYQLIFLVTLFTGLREGEVLGLPWDCVDWENNILTIRQQLQRDRASGEYFIDTPKHDKIRYILVADGVMDLLREQKEKQDEMARVARGSWNNPWNLVFTKEDGSNLATGSVVNSYKKVVKRIGCDELRFHDLRHSFASNSLENGDDAKTVQENLGHHSAAFTLKQYGHVKRTMARASAQRMDLYMQSIMPQNR